MHRLGAVGPQPHLDPLVVGSQRATCANALGVEVGVELAVHDVQHVAVELGGHAGRVVVGGDEPVDVLDEVGAEQERVAGLEPGGDLGEERRARRRARGCRSCSPRNATTPAPAGGHRPRWRSKSPTTACTVDRRTRRRPRRPRRAASPRSRRTARSASSVPASASASSSRRVFSDVPDPSSTSVSAPVRVGDLGARAHRGSPARCGVG